MISVMPIEVPTKRLKKTPMYDRSNVGPLASVRKKGIANYQEVSSCGAFWRRRSLSISFDEGKPVLSTMLSPAFLPSVSWFSPRNLVTFAFLIWTTESTRTVSTLSFHKHSLMVPVSSAIRALVTRARSP